MSSLENAARESGGDSPIPPLIIVPFEEDNIDNHVIDEAFYSEATPTQEPALCEMPATDPAVRKRGRPIKKRVPMRKGKGKPPKKRIISRASSSPSTSISVPSTDSERKQLSPFSAETLSTRKVRSLRTKRQQTASLGANGKATGFQSQKRIRGESAEKPPENRANEASASPTKLDQLADAAMAEKSKGILNNAYPGSSDIPANEPGSSEAIDVSDLPPQYLDLYQKISARYGRLHGNFDSFFPKAHETMTGELLGIISQMMQANPAELSPNAIAMWEEKLKFASSAGFKLGWLFNILDTMREYASDDCVTEETVQRKVEMIQRLKEEEKFTANELKKVQQRLNDLKSEITKACSHLADLRDRQLSANFFGDLI